VLFVMLLEPFLCQFLGLGNLDRSHSFSYYISFFLDDLISLSCRQVKPHVSLNIVSWNTFARTI